MGQINIYKGLSNECQTIEATGSIKSILQMQAPELDMSKAVIIKEGSKLDNDHCITDDDVIFVRYAPMGVTATAVLVTTAAIGVVCAGVALGAAIYSAIQNQKTQRELEKAQKEAKALSEGTEQLPFIKGTSNKAALGYSIPYIMGSMYDVPYRITSGMYAIGGENGSKQYWMCNFVSGYNNAVIQDVSIGTTSIKAANSSITLPDGTTVSTLSDSGTSSYSFDSSSSFYDSENRLDVKYSGAVNISGVEEKVIGTSYGDAVDYDSTCDNYKGYSSLSTAQINSITGVSKQLDSNTYKTDICVAFDGLRYYSKKWKAKSVTFDVYWNNGTDTWYRGAVITTPEVNSRKTVRFATTLSFSAAQCYGKDITIKIIRRTELEETNGVESAYLLYINNYIYDVNKSSSSSIVKCQAIDELWRDKTTRIALKVISSDSTKDSLDEVNCNVYGKARIYNDGAWTTAKYPTRNPAAWVLDLMTTDIHTHSQYADNEIDLEELGAVYDYCEENEFYCDGIITSDTKKSEVISSILAECNTTMYLSGDGLWHFAIEKEQTNAVALLNENCIKNITVSKNFNRKAYAYKTTYTDRSSWAVNTFYQDSDTQLSSQEVYGEKKVITENTTKYITTFDHAYKYSHRLLAKQKLQPREVTVQVGQEGDYYPLYSKIFLQAKQLKIGLSSGVLETVTAREGQISSVTVSDLCDMTDTTKRYGVIIQAQTDSGMNHLYGEVTATGTKTRTLYFKNWLSYSYKPEAGNVYSFGILNEDGTFTKLTNEMMIYSTKQNDSGWELTLKDYNSSIFSYGTVPAYKPNLTIVKETGSTLSAPTYGDVNNAAIEATAGLEADIMAEVDNKIGQIQVDAAGQPFIYADYSSYGLAVNNQGYTTVDQVIKTRIHVVQSNIELDFIFDTFTDLPDGITVTTSYEDNSVSFHIPKDTLIQPGSLSVPVKYRQFVYNFQYVDETDALYTDEEGNIYGYRSYQNDYTEYTLGLSIIPCEGGRYLGAIATIEALEEITPLVIGDYFTWKGEDTETTISKEGSFVQTGVYTYLGEGAASYKWAKDETQDHNASAFSDVLAVANADLETNNSTAYEYLNHLTANSIFVDKLISNTAFINSLFANEITIGENGLIQSKNFREELEDEEGNIIQEGEGFRLTAAGTLECNNGIFRGSIDSGPLFLMKTSLTRGYQYTTAENFWATFSVLPRMTYSEGKIDYTVSGVEYSATDNLILSYVTSSTTHSYNHDSGRTENHGYNTYTHYDLVLKASEEKLIIRKIFIKAYNYNVAASALIPYEKTTYYTYYQILDKNNVIIAGTKLLNSYDYDYDFKWIADQTETITSLTEALVTITAHGLCRMYDLPTSPANLDSGTVWMDPSNSYVLKVVP